MPLFQSSREEEAQDAGSVARNRLPREDEDDRAPPDEHTRLLPNSIDSGRMMLRPDDPAVSPYNLWSVRILRYVTIFLALVSFVWWVLILVSAFATPPGFHMKGSGFFAFAYATLSLLNVVFTLMFFRVPSLAVRILSMIQAGVLLLDMILLLSVTQTRYEEGWVGIVSVVWAVFTSLWTLLTDRTVKWGKAEEEERLTGRAETRRTLTEWIEVLLSTLAYSVMLAVVILMTLDIILRALDAGLAAPGELQWVDNHKYQIHVYCRGNKTDADGERVPTVLFEGGERPVEEGLWSLADNALNNGSISRYCFADRPGLAWSDTAPSPLSAGFVVDVISEALAQAGEEGPWVLASAGIGSIYSRVFASRHGADITGFLMIDPLHEDYLSQVGAPGRGFLLWLRGVVSPMGLDRIPGAIFKGRTSRDRVYGRATQQTGKFIFAKLQENLVAGSFTKREVDSARQIQRRDTPLVIVSSGQRVKDDEEWEEKQRDLTKLTDELRSWDIVNDAPHEVWKTLKGRDKIEKRLKQLTRE